MRLPEYDRLDALGLAELVARREVSALELLEAALERAEARNPPLNAIVARYDDEARARARGPLASGPLSGVPFLLKDLLAAWKGHPLTSSSRLFEGYVPDFDAEVVRRLEAAGLVIFGQTNTPELGAMTITEPETRGPCRNPWSLAHTPAGSSGGAAAAVAARVVPAAHGSDGGGSLRMPASACGVFGLKPTRGRVSLGPAAGEVWSGLAVDGVITRSVRDSAALLDAIAGAAPGDPYVAPPPERPFREEAALPPRRLRIAFTAEPLFGRTTAPECRAAVAGAARLLAGLGHEVEEARPTFSRDALLHAFLVVFTAGVSATAALGARAAGRRLRARDVEPVTWALACGGEVLTALDLALAEDEIHRATRSVAAFFGSHDLLVTPTMAHPPTRVGALAPTRLEKIAVRALARLRSRTLLERMFSDVGARTFEATGNTYLFNLTGQPAMSVPLHWTEDGLPVGVQFAARSGDEGTLFRLAAQLEAARPWADRLPPSLAAELGAAPPASHARGGAHAASASRTRA